MPKEKKDEKPDATLEESDESEASAAKAKAKAEEEVSSKKKEVAATGGKAVNPIGEIEKPSDDAPASEWKAWASECSAKMDQILERLPEPAKKEEAKEEAPKKKAWYDEEIF